MSGVSDARGAGRNGSPSDLAVITRNTTRLRPAVILGVLSALSGLAQTGPGPQTESQEQRIRSLETRIEEFHQEVRLAGRTRELEQEALRAKNQDAAAVQASRDGFGIKSADGDFQIKIGGYIHADGRFYPRGTSNQAVDTFVLRRARPSLQGTLYRFIDFRLLPDFGEGKAALQDAYLEIRYLPQASLRAGKFKTPFGLERLQSATDIVFVERGLPTGLVPNRDLGIQLSGDLAKSRLNYAIGIFNGTPDGGSVDSDGNDGKDYVARLFLTPFQTARVGHPLKGLGFGAAGSTGKQGPALPTFKTTGQSTFFSYASTATASGARTRFSPQGYYNCGPFGILAEYVRSVQKVRRGSDFIAVRNNAWQVAASYFLTGESKSFRTPAPARAFKPRAGGWGAWEIAARYERLTVDPRVYVLGLADPSRSARRAQAWGAGLNWHLNKNVRLSFNYEETLFTGGSAAGDRPRERVLLDRFQIVF